ncbi:TPA: right-handed parallel beta-helix repeat-containing protein [Serratia marcescens]|jgi:hypothetical protein|uniref:right-handed parallel beta-helix repeat-containing protein n=1 Tax=Serratia TaxID=613 RepID=UPI001651585D|nr:right-handed parallel beta-helix repeat-containing protein [Serratia marcescens]ELI8814634.1 right-handed parallel beta-helix repeat-containing protein [Serratia marcescens]ELI8843521.1 right-handed parallel beta-helix repeat-containing protein [Serratia marcescens]MBH2843019.1 right-handed parallel beta-helix repeat-containing protein [Serratia marcescens]MBH2862552.1 right-handed parallel beta-helix repeat-containing protein [Serratia marcescens]MBN5376299.1 right-handed parallel beta-hel
MNRRFFLKEVSLLALWVGVEARFSLAFAKSLSTENSQLITLESIKKNVMPDGLESVLASVFASDYSGSSTVRLNREPSEDNKDMAGKGWSDTGIINNKALLFDSEGKAFSLAAKNGFFSIESLGGGTGKDDSALMEIAQHLSKQPVQLVKDRVYYYGRPVSHSGAAGWIGNNATIKCLPTSSDAPRFPFITSPVTAENAPNDIRHSSSGVRGAVFKDLTIDTDYHDTAGKVGFLYAENTLHDWSGCLFDSVIFKNAKFDNLAMQMNCHGITFKKCSFTNSGQDSVVVRKTCYDIKFIDGCFFSDTAKVQSGGDGVVIKGRGVSVIGCRFENIGLGKKGAAIANNAEDADNAQESSNGVFNNNYFLNCYGGLGIGTVKSSLAFSNNWISNVTASGNTFENIKKVAIGARYVRGFISNNNVVKNQSSARDFSIELLHVADADCDFSVSQVEGGAIHLRDCSGKIKLLADNVALAGFNNAVFIEKSHDVVADLTINNSGRGGGYIDTLNNSLISIKSSMTKGVALQVLNATDSKISAVVRDSLLDGVVLKDFKNVTLTADVKNSGINQKGKYNAVGVFSGNDAKIDLSSDSGNYLYDLFVDKSATGVKVTDGLSALKTNYTSISGK